MDQIEALISVSEFCEQQVVNNCTSNPVTGFAWWLDRNGDKYQYWHGARNETALGPGSTDSSGVLPLGFSKNFCDSDKVANVH